MQHQPTSDWRGAQSHQWLLDWLARPRPGGPFPPGPVHEPPPDFQVDLIRPDDLLTLHVAGYNFKVVPDPVNPRLDRIDCTTDALLVATFPPQNIAETVNDIFTAASGFGFPSPSSRPAQAKPRLPQLITHYPDFRHGTDPGHRLSKVGISEIGTLLVIGDNTCDHVCEEPVNAEFN